MQACLLMLLGCFLADMNVGYVLDETQLTRYFSQFGSVTDCYLPVTLAALRKLAQASLTFRLLTCIPGHSSV